MTIILPRDNFLRSWDNMTAIYRLKGMPNTRQTSLLRPSTTQTYGRRSLKNDAELRHLRQVLNKLLSYCRIATFLKQEVLKST